MKLDNAALKVAVLLGGSSAERAVSLNSGQAVLRALKEKGFEAFSFDPKERNLDELKRLNVDLAFIALHGRGGEDGSIQGALEHLGVTYTGSGVLGSALAMDKVRTKHIFRAMALPTAPYRVLKKSEEFDAESVLTELSGVAMVKPANEGSSIGMAKVTNASELEVAAKNAFEFDEEVLVEQWITGAEYTVAMLNNEPLPVIEMRTPNSFYDYEAKYQTDTTEYFCPCDLPTEQSQQLQTFAVNAFNAVGASGWGRVDAMQDIEGNFYLLEVNTVPGMTEKSLVPMAAKANGLSFADLCEVIVKQAIK